jgi:protein N-terminal methyltransferase
MHKRKTQVVNVKTNKCRYWTALPPTLDTMLGGFNNTRLPRVDITGSRAFLSHPSIKKRLLASSYAHAVDCGAGIGRITKNLLSKIFAKTDLVDPVESFNKTVMEGEFLRAEREAGKIGEVFTLGLQEFTPEKGKYSVIWNQWCLGHLRDADLVEYFGRCREGLVPDGGVIVVKENLASGQDNYDGTDSSFTRTEKTLRGIFAKAGLKIIHVAEQHGISLVSLILTCRVAGRSVYGQNVRTDITTDRVFIWLYNRGFYRNAK